MSSTDALTRLARAIDRQMQQLDALGLRGEAKKAAGGRVFPVARETGSTVPAVMSEVMRQWQETGNPPRWLTEDVESEETP